MPAARDRRAACRCKPLTVLSGSNERRVDVRAVTVAVVTGGERA